MKKHVIIDPVRCDPRACAPGTGMCAAAAACGKGLLEQDGPFEPCLLLSEAMCAGCGRCIRACPRRALRMAGGGYP